MSSLAEDWITLWQSELTALASDREAAETLRATLALWAQAARAGIALGELRTHEPPGRAGPAAPAGAPAAAAAPDAGRDARLAEAVDRLAGRLAELERRLARLDPGGDAGGPGGR